MIFKAVITIFNHLFLNNPALLSVFLKLQIFMVISKLDKENEQKVKKQNKTAESIAYSYHKSILITPAY